MEVLVVLACAVDVCVSRIRSAARVAVDPLQPVLGTVSGDQVLQIIGDWDVLRFDCTEEVLHDWVGIVAKADFDWSLEAMYVAVLASPLVCLVFLHERNKSLGVPALHLEVVVIRSRGTSVHLETISTSFRLRNREPVLKAGSYNAGTARPAEQE